MVFDLDTVTLLIDVLGDEMVKFCLENPEKAIAFAWLFSFSIAEFDQKYNIKSGVSKLLLSAQEAIGEDLCVWCANNFQELPKITAALDSCRKSSDRLKKSRGDLKQLLQAVNPYNSKAKISSLIKAFSPAGGENLIRLFRGAEIEYLSKINRLNSQRLDEEDLPDLRQFLRWLREDRAALMIREFQNLFGKSRYREIIRGRIEGATLQQMSLGLGISRQRVRQLEQKILSRFNNYVAGFSPHYVLSAFSENSDCVTADDICQFFGDLTDIFIFCLQENNCPSARWHSELQSFIIGGGDWYERLIERRQQLPEQIGLETVNPLLAELTSDLELPITFITARKILLSHHKLYGKVYLRRKMSLAAMYSLVLKKYYPNGIKLYNEAEAHRFRHYVHKLFGNVYLPENNRAIAVRLADLTILCDKGKRILPDCVVIPRELLAKIHDAILQSEQPEIMFKDLFEQFKNELLSNTNISNRYFLQGLLRYSYAREFTFTRYTVRKNNAG